MAVVVLTTVSDQHCPLCAKPLTVVDARNGACGSCRFRWGGKPPAIVIRLRAPRPRWVSSRLAEVYREAMAMDPWLS